LRKPHQKRRAEAPILARAVAIRESDQMIRHASAQRTGTHRPAMRTHPSIQPVARSHPGCAALIPDVVVKCERFIRECGHDSRLPGREELAGTIDPSGCPPICFEPIDHLKWRHPERQAIFVGDFIDRRPNQVECVEIARSLVDAGAAQAVLGNHEFNAIAWFLPDTNKPGEFLRPHFSKKYGTKNREQHEAFLREINASNHERIIDWFLTLPMWLVPQIIIEGT
jgi:hypothetical protein